MGSSTLFPAEDTLRENADYHRWKMSIDLTLEDQGVLGHVRGNIVEPPSNAPPVDRNKWKNKEIKAKKIIRDSINKRLVAYIFDLNTSKEIYDRLVSLFKVNNENQEFFLRNKEIKKGKDESMQTYFLRITEIKNDPQSIGETITNREMALTTLEGLPYEWYVFETTLLNNNVIPSFEELMVRCIQEEKRVEEQEIPLPKGPPPTFSSHAKKRNNSGSKSKRKAGSKGGRKGRCFICNKECHCTRECPDRKDSHRDDDQNPSHGNRRDGKFNSKVHQVDGSPLGVMSYDTSLQSEHWHRRCAKEKLKRGPFPSSQSKTSDILQLVHSSISEVGIKRETTTPHTPEQNGVAGRKNHTIVEAVWAMLHDQRLSKFLWAETTNTAVYALIKH
eukprot:PITA_29871